MLKPIKLTNNNYLSSSDMTTDETLHVLELARSFKNDCQNVEFKKNVGPLLGNLNLKEISNIK